ncbi:MAG: EAL domain-containing protein [Pseudomonadota bacterium]
MNIDRQQAPDRFSQAIIDALDEHIAVIDASGFILAVNRAWREFARGNGADPAAVSEGANYLEVCDKSAARGDAHAATACAMIRAVVAGQRETASMDYPCNSPTEQRWFKLKITREPTEGPLRIVIEHENVIDRKLTESRLRLKNLLLASVEQAVIATDLDGLIIYWNPFAQKMYGWSSAEVLGRSILDVIPSESMRVNAHEIMTRLKAGESWDGEYLVRHRDGHDIPIHVTDSPIRDERNQLIGVIGISTDITERKKNEQALKLSDMVYQAIGEAIMVFDPDYVILTVNPAFSHMCGYTEQEIVGHSSDLLKPADSERFFPDEIRQPLEKTGHWQGKIRTRRKSGETYLQWLMIDTIYDERGKAKMRIGMFSAVTDQKRAEETIWQQANFDALTGLPNRSMFHDRLEHEIQKATRDGHRLALMYIDLDQFKEINDTLGHDTGDILLQHVARRLSACIRQADTVARIGGDEFTVILTELENTGSVERVARGILQTLAEPFYLENDTIHVSGSIGITLLPEDATNADILLKNADQAMYAAKSQGRNQFNYFTPCMQQAAQARMRLANDLRDALACGQFDVVYQPIVELATGAIHKAEALIRWRHPQRGMVNPAEFIPIAEQTGMIITIGEWVCQQAVRQAEIWRATIDPQFQISVNMSPVQLRKPRDTRGSCFEKRSTLSCASQDEILVVEITEGLLLEASDVVTAQLQRFRDTGIQLSIDDFGTGYSALSYLKKFHIDYLKIDQSFVLKMNADSDDLALCEAIIVMGHKLGMKVIAEGVETPEQRDLLTAAGCDYGQGYLFGRPVHAAEMSKFLESGQTR